jgi:6,7-dimethyl-8-ribityllumazine synthase
VIDSVVLLGTIIAGATEAVKNALPEKVHGIVTVGVAVLMGIILALLDKEIGLNDISVAEGILTALGTVGVVGAVKKIG